MMLWSEYIESTDFDQHYSVVAERGKILATEFDGSVSWAGGRSYSGEESGAKNTQDRALEHVEVD